MSSLPIFDQLYAGLTVVFGQPGYIFALLLIIVIVVMLLAGLEGSMVGLIIELIVSILAVYGFATYGLMGYAILVTALALAIALYRSFVK